MCSGCAGDYAGGFEFDDSEEPITDCKEDVSDASLRAAPDVEFSGFRGRAAEGFETREEIAEDCEILVSGTQIIEIRVFAANYRADDPLRKTRTGESDDAASKHSLAASAKYYQTRDGCEKNHWNTKRSQRILQTFAHVCKARCKRWLEQTRRLVGRRAARST